MILAERVPPLYFYGMHRKGAMAEVDACDEINVFGFGRAEGPKGYCSILLRA
jgi:hypothetical protein